MKLEINHLAPYLPYGLKGIAYVSKDIALDNVDIIGCNRDELYCEFISEKYKNMSGARKWFSLFEIKPILLPMSSLYTEMEDGTVPMIEIAKIILRPYLQDIDTFKVTTLPDDDSDYKVQVFRDSEDSIIEAIVERNLVEGFVVMTTESQDIIPACNLLEAFTYLFSHHFDVWNLIGQNLAIDKTKIK